MNVTQRIVGFGLALVLALGGFGVRYALRSATEDRVEKISENAAEAVADGYDYTPPSIPVVTVPTPTVPETTAPGATTPATTPETTAPAAPTVPKGWPAALKLVDGLTIESSSDVAGLNVVGTVAGDVAGITEAIHGQLAEAGFTVDQTRSAGGATIATGADGEATVLVSPAPEDPATVRVSYIIRPAA